MAKLGRGSIIGFDGEVVNENGDVVGRTRTALRIDECRMESDGTTLVVRATPLRIIFLPPDQKEG